MKHFIFCTLLLCSFYSYAQHSPSVEYSTREGLSQMQVMCVFEDSRGYIWAATKGGLSKFNGENFENFYISDGLINNNIDYITEDSQQNIWLKYGADGYSKFDGQKFTNFKLPRVTCSNIVEYQNKMIFCRKDSLFFIENDKIKFKNRLSFIDSKNNLGVNLLVEKLTGLLYLNYYTKFQDINTLLYCFNINRNKFELLFQSQKEAYQLFAVRDKVLVLSNHGETSDFYLLKNKLLLKYFNISASKTTFTNFPDFDFSFGYDGKTWVYSKNDKKIEQISNSVGVGFTTSNRKLASQRLYAGTEKGLVCTFLNGVKYFKETEVPYAWGVIEDAEKNIWISNFQAQLQKFDGQKFLPIKNYYDLIRLKNTELIIKDKAALDSWYFGPLKDKNNKLWFPRLNGVMVVDNSKFEYLNPKLDSDYFFNLAEDAKRNKIIGCGFGGIAVLDNTFPYKHELVKDTAKMFQNNRLIFTATVDTQGNYWIGGRNIAKYNPDTKQFKYYADYNQKLSKRGVGNIVIDTRGGVWAGLAQDGLAKLNSKTDKFDLIFQKYLAKNASVVYMGQINEKYFVIADNLNLFIIDLDELYLHGKEKVVKVLNYHNGFLGIEPGQEGFFKDSEGKIWVPSGTVLSYFDPKKLSFEPKQLRTFIRSINDKKLPFTYENEAYFELEKDKNEVKIEVESVGEDKSANAQFSYRIAGFVNKWSEWQTEKTIYLTNMPSGKFEIEVRSKPNLVESDLYPVTHLKFKVNTAFWKSPDFYQYAFFIGLILLGIVGFILNRNFSQRKKIQKQKKINENRERELNILQIQTTQAQLNPHFIFNVLGTLQNQITKNKTQEASENIVKLSHLIRSFLSATVFDNRTVSSIIKLEIVLEKEITLLRSYIEFEQLQRDNFDFEIIETPPVDASNYKIQPMLLQPFVENAIKHGFNELKERGKLKITFSEIDDYLVCEIDDNGIGREQSKILQQNSIAKYKSLGTDLVLKRIEVLKRIGYLIDIQILDKEKGTKISISIRFEGHENRKD